VAIKNPPQPRLDREWVRRPGTPNAYPVGQTIAATKVITGERIPVQRGAAFAISAGCRPAKKR